MKDICPCGSGLSFNDCCGPVISGKTPAKTAEALMRSRYSAYATGAIEYILKSCVQDANLDEEATRRWSSKAEWRGLRIIGTEKGGPADSEGTVEFSASYIMDGLKEEHRETAKFVKKDGIWLYESGNVKTTTVVRESPKVGRNESCPCGSGKKYKQCCGK